MEVEAKALLARHNPGEEKAFLWIATRMRMQKIA
jgi:hypothetical protein